ncbi:MAG: T9SS type A sorting domain-containing protein [Bacteroidota bacterium]|nr:T9SS type A sorting domain-containing protein [Bacteroidota bacterium]
MITKFFFVAVFLSQILLPQKLSHPLRAPSPNNSNRTLLSVKSFPDTMKVLAILVQFKFEEKNDSRTSGNGQFDTALTTERIIDSPPHNSAYFADHFVFAQNYFSKASNGKQNIATTVFDKVITLKKEMKDYAPVNSNLPLAEMLKEAWYTLDSLYPGEIQYQQYSMFTVFHAGVGKDIDLRASLGYDPTPLDIPSLYFSLSSLQNLLGNSFQGFSLKNSPFKIPNSVVLPETEVRRIPSVGGDFVLKLSINGLLIASIGSHLGLPDLFETTTGKTAIGRFGLMDGQSIFSFAGICPPEPSAWEKIFLGWTTPIEVFGNKTLNAPAVGLYPIGNDTIYKIPISAKEYYLVENRNRDAQKNNHFITMKWNGQTIQKTFSQDEDFFSNANIDSAFGVVVDVDELDWSLPGIINAYNDYRGGILIWHIDETIIEKNIASNTINADPKRRGIDLEEADGSQDLGQSYDFGNPASGSEDGSPIDYWFDGNIFPNYKNEFSENTSPNTLTNTYAKSHVTIKNFSVASPRMTFEANVGDADIQLMKVIKRKNLKFDNNDAPLAADLNGDGKQELIYTSGDSIYVLRDDLTPYLNNTTGLFYPIGGRFQPVYLTNFGGDPNPNNNYKGILVSHDKTAYLFNVVNTQNSIADTLSTLTLSEKIVTPPSYNAKDKSILLGVDSNRYARLDYQFGANSTIYIVNTYSPLADIPLILTSNVRPYSFYSKNKYLDGTSPNIFYSYDNKKIIAATLGRFTKTNNLTSKEGAKDVIIFDDNSLIVSINGKQITFGVELSASLAVADINNDGAMEILLGTSNGLFCINENGIVQENFPLKVLDGGKIVGSPIVVKMTGSTETAILFGSSNGQIYAYTSKGKIVYGFPLQTGGIVSSPVLWGDKLVVASTDSSIYVWKTGNLFDTSKILWGNFLADNYHSNFVENTGTVSKKSSEFLPKKFAYNWPNPVYSGSTNIRYFLGKSGTVKIKIVNLAGELVEELNGTNYAGMDNEVQWNITTIQSGIYFAQITASGNGEQQSQIVKIAVVK